MSKLKEMLEYSINQIDDLYDYFISQNDQLEIKVRKNIEKYTYGIILDRFFSHELDKELVPNITDEEINIAKSIVEDYIVNEKEGKIEYKINKKYLLNDNIVVDPTRAREGYTKLIQQPTTLQESMLIMLLIKYEESISILYDFLISKYPKAYISDKSISYSELIQHGSSIESVKRKFISNEVDEFMRRPISEWYDCFKNKQKAKFLFENNLFEYFKEVYYRRNLVVHNRGIVNSNYLCSVENTNAELGERLKIDKAYLDEAFKLTKLMLIDTYFGLRKIDENEEELTELIFTKYGYESLINKEWEHAKYIFEVVLQKKDLDSIYINMAKVNRWIAIKNIGGVDSIAKDVNSYDVTAMQTQFSVAKYALINDFDRVSEYLQICVNTKEIPAYYIKTWPLLNEYRMSKQYEKFSKENRKYLETDMYEPDAVAENSKEKMSNDKRQEF